MTGLSAGTLLAQPKYNPLPEPFFEYGHNLNKIDIQGNAAVIIVFKDNNHLNFAFPHNNLDLAEHYSKELHNSFSGTPIKPVLYFSYAEFVDSNSLDKAYQLMKANDVKNLVFFDVAEVQSYEFYYLKMTSFNGERSFYDHYQYCYTKYSDDLDQLIKKVHQDIISHSRKFSPSGKPDSEANFVVLEEEVGILAGSLPDSWLESRLLFAKYEEADIPSEKPRDIQKTYYKVLRKHNEDIDKDNADLESLLNSTSLDHKIVSRETWRNEGDLSNTYFIDYYVDRTHFGLNQDTSNAGPRYQKASTTLNFVLINPNTNSAHLIESLKIGKDLHKVYSQFIIDLDYKLKILTQENKLGQATLSK